MALIVAAVTTTAGTVGGCSSPADLAGPDRSLTAALVQSAPVQLRGPDNPTLEPAVLSAYWDSARLRGATPQTAAPRPARSSAQASPVPVPSTEPPAGAAPNSAPVGAAILVRSPTGPGAVTSPAAQLAEVAAAPPLEPAGQAQTLAARTVGRLFFTMAGRPRSCTATVVASTSGSVIATAGHCLLTDDTSGARQAAANLLFVPGYRDAMAPFGRWPVQSVHLPVGWSGGVDWAQDVAFLRVARADQGPIQGVLGAQGVVFTDRGQQGPTVLLGYPAVPPFTGEALRWCATAGGEPSDRLDPGGVAVRCAMTPGYSGGPALAQFDPQTGAGFVVGVASHDYATGTLYGPRLGPATLAAFREADQ